jgi:hypothetical protein
MLLYPDCIKINGVLPFLRCPQQVLIKIQHCLLLFLLIKKHLIIHLQLGDEISSLSETRLLMEKGCIGITLL